MTDEPAKPELPRVVEKPLLDAWDKWRGLLDEALNDQRSAAISFWTQEKRVAELKEALAEIEAILGKPASTSATKRGADWEDLTWENWRVRGEPAEPRTDAPPKP
jgi:hypothetical protein